MDVLRIMELCTPENMSLAELCEDAQFKKLPDGEIRNYIERLIEIASGRADKVISATRKLKPGLTDICRSKGVSVNLIDSSDTRAGRHFRAEIYYDEKIINIMNFSVDHIYNALIYFNFNSGDNARLISIDDIIDIHIAHELYHLIEFNDSQYTPDMLPSVTGTNIFGFKRKLSISKASEAAAHIFCMRLLDLPFHPKMLDYLCLLANGEVTRDRLIEFLEELNGQ